MWRDGIWRCGAWATLLFGGWVGLAAQEPVDTGTPPTPPLELADSLPPLLEPPAEAAPRPDDVIDDIVALRALLGAAFSSQEEADMFRQALESLEEPPAPPGEGELAAVSEPAEANAADVSPPATAPEPSPWAPAMREIAEQLRHSARLVDERAYHEAEQGRAEASSRYRELATQILRISLELQAADR